MSRPFLMPYAHESAMLCEAVQPPDAARPSLRRAAQAATWDELSGRNLTVAELDTQWRAHWGECLIEAWEEIAPEPVYPVPERSAA